MLNPVLSIAKKIVYPTKNKFTILTACTHEGFESSLAKTGHDFYAITGPNLKGWDYHTRPVPANYYIFHTPYDKLKIDVPVDLVLCQNRLSQYQLLRQVSERYHIPMIVLDHTEPFPGLTKAQIKDVKTWRGDVNVFITEHNKTTWEGKPDDIVINHGIDVDVFNGWTGENPEGASVVNHFATRDVFCGWTLWQEITKEVPVKLIGENPGLSKSAGSVQELVAALKTQRFFLNTSQLSPCPLSLLEAAAIGMPIISTTKQQVPKIFTHEKNALLSNDKDDLVRFCKHFIDDKNYAKDMGAAARELIEKEYGIKVFVNNWNRVFQKAYEIQK